MRIGDVVRNFVNIGTRESWRPTGQIAIVIDTGNSVIYSQRGAIARTNLTVMLNDGSLFTYDSASFEIINEKTAELK